MGAKTIAVVSSEEKGLVARAAGADAIYPPGTVISRAAAALIRDLRARLDG